MGFVIAVLSAWSWFAIALVCVVGFFLQLVLFVLTAPFDGRRAVVGRFYRLMAVTATKLIPFWRFAVSGPVPRGSPGKCVVVSNHASHADPFLISHLPWEMKWLGKAVLFKVPFTGWSMWLAGDVPVKRGDRDSAGEAMQQCARWLERGMPVMIFPEGTRSATGDLGPFKDGAFRLALDTGADLLVLAVDGTHTALPKHSWKFGYTRARVTVGPRIATAGKSVEELKRETRAAIEGLQAKLRAERAGGISKG